ncbi:MAG TPA: hypothetical protein VLH60_03855, partial [Sedimentisphaerales bacterium]|nr:hypothetical protein [Sedimentisphaerales bacterium]
QAELEWLDIGWYMLKADNTLSNAYNDEGMLVITFDPNDLRECLSAIDAFVVCLVLDWPGQPSRLSLVVNGRAVVMHRHSGNRYISDYLFITDEPRAVGPQVDNWGNPCYILPQVGDGRIVSAVLPDANMPDVINRWLSDNPYSDLNADGVINFADFALSAAKQYGKVDGLE